MFVRILLRSYYWLAVLIVMVCPAVCQPTTDEVLAQVIQTDRAISSGEGTTIVSAYGGKVSQDVSLPPERQTTYKWRFQIPAWQHEVTHSTAPGTSSLPVTNGFSEGNFHRTIPNEKRLQIFGVACKGKVSVYPLWAQHFGLMHILDNSFPSLSEEMTQANARVIGTEALNGVETVVLSGISPIGQSVKWWLAPDYGYRPVKVETRWKAKPDSQYREFTVTNVYENFEEVTDTIRLPLRKSMTKTAVRTDGALVILQKNTAINTFTSINKPVDPSKLKINLPEGATMTYTEDIAEKSITKQ